ncbi:MAG TPA: hypothetical protein VG013_08585, partial [Gemmataceae bacterium]|nr:hypothetical protein [Gemmataceae bacterium]
AVAAAQHTDAQVPYAWRSGELAFFTAQLLATTWVAAVGEFANLLAERGEVAPRWDWPSGPRTIPRP